MKLFTTACILIGVLMIVAWPWLLGPAPKRGQPKAKFLAYTQRSSAYLAGMCVCLVGSTVGSILIVRKTKRDYAEQTRDNLRKLVAAQSDESRPE